MSKHEEPTPESLAEIPEVDFTKAGIVKYILNAEKVPVPCADLLKWSAFYDSGERFVGETTIGDARVSTVFLAVGRPNALFETMIFGGLHDGYQERYRTWAEAALGHARVVDNLKVHGMPEISRSVAKRLAVQRGDWWVFDAGIKGLLEGLPAFRESAQHWKKTHAHTSRETLFRRALYGGRKGRAAARRLGKAGKAMQRLTALYKLSPGAARGLARTLGEVDGVADWDGARAT